MRIVVLGGGFGGVTTVRHLERVLRRHKNVLDWTVAVFFRPGITRVDLRVEREQVKQARQLVDRSSEIVRAMQIESAFRAPSVNAIPGVDEPARRMHLS
jgi:NADH dehydrogenase FAD-containing subunit